MTRQRWLAAIGPLFSVLLFALAARTLHDELAGRPLADVVTPLRGLAPARIALAALFAAGSYVALTGYDALAIRWTRAGLPYPRIALASFISYVFSHNVGLSFLGGSAVRYRMLTSWGIRPGTIARVLTFDAVTWWLGFLALGGIVSIAFPLRLPGGWNGTAVTSRPVGLALLAVLSVYLLQSARSVRTLRAFGSELELPGLGVTCAQIAISSIDWLLASAVFATLLPDAPGLSFPTVVSAFMLAQLLGVASQVPGGLGVFETLMVLLLSPWLPGHAVLGSAIAFRIVYYLGPFAIAVSLFTLFELGQRTGLLKPLRRMVSQWVPEVVPHVFTATTFAAGVVLLISGSTPPVSGRFDWLARILPLPALELSHLLASLVGVVLLFLARALQRRVDAAYRATLGLLVAGALLSIAKGLDWEEAALLLTMALALLPCRRHFHRKSAIFAEAFTPGWTTSLLLVLFGTLFVVRLAHRHVEFANELWWQFAVDAEAPRSLRALLASTFFGTLLALYHLLGPARPQPAPPSAEEIERARPIVRKSARACAHLALVGDKQLLFADHDDGFLMYGISGRCWIAMGDPIGPPEVRRELAWRFIEAADRHGGLPAFYEVQPENLPVYLDLGLSLHKLGEEARVPLASFTLDGSARRDLRGARRRAERAGARFEILETTAVASALDELESVSDAWLANHHTREKRFSLGRFDRSYLARTPVAVVRTNGKIVAFANLWVPETRDELSVDLMRYADGAPPGVMDLLFCELMLWGKQAGFAWFGLGMAPLAGFEHHRLAPLWNRLGALAFRHGENFYNFRGLRTYKAKFDPVWEPRYLASPGSLALPVVLTETASLIAGGITGLVAR